MVFSVLVSDVRFSYMYYKSFRAVDRSRSSSDKPWIDVHKMSASILTEIDLSMCGFMALSDCGVDRVVHSTVAPFLSWHRL